MTEPWEKGGAPYAQDTYRKLPFEVTDFSRKLPTRGPSGLTLYLGMLLISGWGFYRFGQGVHIENQCVREERKRRMALIPFLQAEQDRKYLRWEKLEDEAEEKIMKDVPGWEPMRSTFYTRWMPRPQRIVPSPWW